MLGPTRPWNQLTPVQALVEQACDPTLPEPNYAVMVELTEMIAQRKANSAREAIHALLPNINSRNPNQALLALTVLDHLVKHGGYAIHLQISTKEFLNELVRRFPERPPMVTGRVMGRILELIHEWKNTLCVHSKYKEDLVHIRDMHRLLSYKAADQEGYRFKSFDAARAMASANPNEDLKSPEELEEEDRAAKSAKLQELIRRGTPRDLAAAQELMKALAGAEPEKAVDYASQTLNELDKVQSKAILLNDMLNNAREGERIGLEGDAYEQVAQACRGARPRIQKWIEEDTGEREGMMDRLLLCNDLINNALERFEAVKVGDWSKAQALVEAHNPNKKAADLISFDAFADEEPLSGDGGLSLPSGGNPSQGYNNASSSSSASAMTASGLPLDLFSAPSPTPSPGLSLFSSAPTYTQAPRQDPMAFFNMPPQQPRNVSGTQPAFGSQTQPNSVFGGIPSAPSQQQQQQQQRIYQPQPQAQASSQFFSSPLQPQTQPQGYSLSPQPPRTNGQQATPTPGPAQPQKKNDAFADLVDLMS